MFSQEGVSVLCAWTSVDTRVSQQWPIIHGRCYHTVRVTSEMFVSQSFWSL